MEFLPAAVLSGLLYDMLKHQVSLTTNNIKGRLRGWLIEDSLAERLEMELDRLKLTDEMSESALEKKLSNSEGVLQILKSITPNQADSVTQTHHGKGDNVAGDKIIYNK